MLLFHSRNFFLCLLILIPGLLVLLPGCNQQQPEVFPRERSYLSVIHAYGDLQAVDIELESFGEVKRVSEGLSFNRSWPAQGYASLLSEAGAGPQDTGVVIQLKDWRTKEILVPLRVLRLHPGERSTVGIIDSSGRPELFQIRDDFEEPAPGRANVRFMNFSHLYPAVDLESSNDSIFIDRINYLLASKFIEYPAGTYTLYFRHSFTRQKIDSLVNVELRPRKTYNVYLTQDKNNPRFGIIELE